MTEKRFNAIVSRAVQFHKDLRDLHEYGINKYGFDYSDRDLDWIIDSIEYGGGGITLAEFDRIMTEEMNQKPKRSGEQKI